jgi:hypothetical protein
MLHFYPLALEQAALPIQSAGEAAEFLVRGQDTVAWNQNWNRVRAARAAHGADGLGFADRLRYFAVALRPAKRDFPQRVPDGFLEFGSRQIQRREFSWLVSGQDILQGGCRRAMPIAGFGRDALPRVRVDRQVSPAVWDIQFSQAFFRIARDELAVARGNREFNQMTFHNPPWFQRWMNV